jgi:hypothetical protein
VLFLLYSEKEAEKMASEVAFSINGQDYTGSIFLLYLNAIKN